MDGAERKATADCGLHRRSFLRASSASITTVLLCDVFGDRVAAEEANLSAQLQTYPRVRLASVSELKDGVPVLFDFPAERLHTGGMLVKLGTLAGGGIGPGKDIVAFSTRCTHMGGDMSDGLVPEHYVIGCADHLTTFDLTRHGLVVAGHATTALPQFVLELDAGDIYVSGIIGLLYGYHQNP